jgi:phosphinothricin acetyltransferase
MIGTNPALGFKHGRWVDIVTMQRPLGGGDGAVPYGEGWATRP